MFNLAQNSLNSRCVSCNSQCYIIAVVSTYLFSSPSEVRTWTLKTSPTKARQNGNGSGSGAGGQGRGHADGVEMPANVNVEDDNELVNENIQHRHR